MRKMEYVIRLLKNELLKEKCYRYQHEKALRENVGNVSDKRVFEMSVRMAEERIPQLELSLKILKKKP